MSQAQELETLPVGRIALATAASIALSALCFLSGFRGVLYDSWHYYKLATILSTEGLWNMASRVRMYGYPLFVAVVTGFHERTPGTVRLVVAAAQVVTYLACAFYVARVSGRLFGPRPLSVPVFALLALNPVALIHATELLSDSLSSVLLAAALFGSLERGHARRRAFLAFLSAGAAIAVRPANLAVVPALAVLWLVRVRRHRESGTATFTLGAAALALALAPQLITNVRAYGEWSPLLVDRLYSAQTGWGTKILKYGTLVVPGQDPRLVYANPLAPEGASTPASFARVRPLGYAATLAVHGFAMVDQDLPFTYITNPRPWYRWPLSLANYAFFFLAVWGLALLLLRRRDAGASLYGIGALLFSAALVAIYLPVAVENRFSLPLYVILAPSAVEAVRWLASQRSGTVVATAMAGAGFIGACVQISLWLTKQSPYLSALSGR